MTTAGAPTVAEVLEEATRRLRQAGVPGPARDAASLVALALGTDRGGVVARKPDTVSPPDAARIAGLVAARLARKPLQHLAGRAEFCGLEFAVTPDVLIPRPETEDLVQATLEAGLGERARVADLGTGSGCVAVALAHARPSWRLTALDSSREALAIARANAATHGVAERIVFVESDFGELEAKGPAFDAMVSNPPYVSEAEWLELEPEVRDHEPKGALVPGPSGNEAYAVLAPRAHALLALGGLLALELGWKSEAAVRAIVAGAGFREIVVRPDLQGIPRVLTARK